MNALLLVATAGSVFWVFFDSWGDVRNPDVSDRLVGAGLFAFSALLILGAHEMGHWAMAKAHGVETSLPYFIPLPVPFGFGTLGAVIRLRGRVPTKNALVDIGAAGPLAGLLVAVPLLVVGLRLSPVVDLPPSLAGATHFPPPTSLLSLAAELGRAARAWFDGASSTDDVAQPAAVLFGDNLLTLALQRLLLGPLGEGRDVSAHPVFLAAWFGLLVTMLNLMPVGQLDGGHLVHAWFGPHAVKVGHWVASALIVLAVCCSASWLVWFVMVTKVVGFEHPPVADESVPLSLGRKVTCAVCFVLTVLVFMPLPLGLL